MSPRRQLSISAAILLTVTVPGVAAKPPDAQPAGPPWIRSLEDGQRAAQESGKDLMIVFTGHGWCAHCIILDREVFQQPEFVEATEDSFVYVELDFTFGDSTEEGQREAKLRELAERFLIEGYPTVVLADSATRPYAYIVGYDDGFGVKPYVARVNAARDAYQRLVDSEAAESPEEFAASLAAVAEQFDVEEGYDDPLLNFYSDEVERVLAALPESNAARRALATRQKNQRLQEERELTWAPIWKRVMAFYESEDWSGGYKFIQATTPTLEDPVLRLQLERKGIPFLLRAERFEEALALTRRLQENEELDIERRRRLANEESRLLLKLGRVDEAIARYDDRIAAAEEAGDQEQVSWLLSWKLQMMLATDRLEETIAVARATRDAAPHGSDDWLTATYIAARKLREAGDFEEALQLSKEQLEVDPQGYAMADIAEAHLELGAAAEAAGWLDKAERAAARLRESPRIGDSDFAEAIEKRVVTLRERLTPTE